MIPSDDLKRGRFACLGAIFVALGLLVLALIACPSVHAQEPAPPPPTAILVGSERENPSARVGEGSGHLYLFVGAANVADLWTTKRVVTAGGRESNPVLGASYPRIVVTKTLITAGIIGAAEWLQRKGHPKIAKTLLWSDTGAMSVVSAHNVREVRR